MSNKVIIQEFPYNQTGLQQLRDNAQKDGHDNRYLYQYPTVYIINDKSKNGKNQYAVYIGETNNIAKRTTQHLIDDPKSRNDWNSLSKSKTAQIYVIAHKHFNKSLTLDIENQLMLHLGTVDNVIKIYNRRTNQQGEYYPVEELDSIFNAIWTKLHKKNKELFPALSTIRDLAIFKSSPFHKLKQEQLIARNVVMEKIDTALENERNWSINYDYRRGRIW
ncbi:GIY-YIG nuclease family protein [Ligilactobacillus equi]|uniref:GIY-YIG nuclease family protein n=1 Tax=Ligilactobacillus equi TaxID=137357 RepID=UPI000B26917F